MQSAFDTALASGLGPIYDVMGEPVTYTRASGESIVCTAIVDRDLTRYGDTLEVTAGMVQVHIRIEDLADRPRRGEKLLAGGLEFTVGDLLASDLFEHRFVAS